MNRHERLLQTILGGRSDANIRFSDLRTLLEYLGFEERIRGSHHLFDKEDIVEIVNLQSRSGHAKPYQVRQVPPAHPEIQTGRRRLMHKYEIILYWSNEDQTFIAEVPELPGCMAHGDDQETALRNVKDAIQFWIERAQELGRAVPQPKGERLMLA